MAPASEEAPVFDPPQPTPAPALAPAPAPASDSIAPSSSKRRWSPCTWRYAIEEGQPELGSRPRSGSHSQLLYSATVSSTKKGDHESVKINKKLHHSHHHQQQHYHRHQPKEALKKRPKLEEEDTDDECNDEKEGDRNHLHHEDDEGDDEKEEKLSKDRIKYSYGNENSKRRRQTREMSPSEIYFCEVCSAKAKASSSGLRLSRSKRSPSHVPDS